jgi:Rod binding domain-containing protein
MINKTNPNIPPQQYVNHKGEKIPKAYMEVAKGMETQFINHMFNELRKTVQKNEPESQASQYYKSMQDYERSKILSGTDNGIGLKDMILDEIYPKHLRQKVDVTANKQIAIRDYQKNQEGSHE